MSNLLWTCDEGSSFSAQTGEFRLLVVPAAARGAYRFEIFRRLSQASRYGLIGSGHRTLLREAIEAVERLAEGLVANESTRANAVGDVGNLRLHAAQHVEPSAAPCRGLCNDSFA